MTPDDYYREIRDHIKHEDLLCNQRMTWLVTLQAFLFGAYGFSLSAEFGPHGTFSNVQITVATAREGIALMGILSSFVIFASLFGALRSIDRLARNWHDYASKMVLTSVPPIIGTYSELQPKGTGLGQIPILVIPVTFPLIWAYMLFGDTPLGNFFAAFGLIIAIGLPAYMFARLGRDFLKKAKSNRREA